MKVQLNNFRIIYREHYDEVIDFLKNNKPSKRFTFRKILQPMKNKWPLGNDLASFNVPKNIKWYRIIRNCGKFSAPNQEVYSSYSAIVKTKKGKFLIFRNGNNLSKGNMGILDLKNEVFYFRRNKEQIINLFKLLTYTRNEIPLLCNKNFCPTNKKIFLEIIDGTFDKKKRSQKPKDLITNN